MPSADLVVTVKVLFGPEVCTTLWPDGVEWVDVVLDSRALLRRKAKSFALAASFLPPSVRDDAAVVYALCREVDDTADDTTDRAAARHALDRLRQEVLGVAAPRPQVEVFRAIAQRVGLPLSCMTALIDGVAADLGTVRIADDAELLQYCYRVASTVGLMMTAVIGVRRREASPFAVDLGLAMQLTNIVRDIAEDAALGRVYLPESRLRAAGLSAESIVEGSADPDKVRQVAGDLVALAERFYRSADDGMRDIPFRSRVAILVASRVYAGIGCRARRMRSLPSEGRVVVPWWEKAWLVVRAVAAAHAPSILGLAPRRAHDAALHQAIAGWPGTG